MELALSLGDASNTPEFLEHPKSTHQDQEPTKINAPDFCMALGLTRSSPSLDKITQEIDEDGDHRENTQRNLLPVNLIRSFKNRSSTPAAEDVSSANSVGSPLIHMDIGMYRGNGNKASEDDEENGITPRKKLRLSKQQSAFLEDSFKEHSTLNPKHKLALAKQLNLRPRQVEVWFQNRRARTKLKQTEVDCEYLKRCCATLTEENRRLQKELLELRALKTSNPFHMQPAPTTLTMCPSCEKVATGSTKTSTVPFHLTRPRFYPFSEAPTRPNDPSAAS